jgi:phospholipid transport system substrate-binding protein
MKFLPTIAALVFAFVTTSTFASASAVKAEAQRLGQVVEGALDAIYDESSKGQSTEAKQARVRSVIEAEYDLNVIIRRAIGRNWHLMSADEQDRVLQLVKQLVVKAYVEGMNGKARPVVDLKDPLLISDKRMEIPSEISVDGKTVYVLYRLGKMRSGWQIYDIVAEDISVVANYRQQIDDHFRKGTGKELIDKLEELLTKKNLDEDVQL